MSLIIDGFNLIYKFPDLEHCMNVRMLNQAREGLLEILSDYLKQRKEKVTVVFDGKRNPGDNTEREVINGIDVFYSHHLSADHLIKELIKNSLKPRELTVVTSDKEILFYAGRFRVKKLTSEEFSKIILNKIKEEAETLPPEKNENPEISHEEISFWEKIFSKKKK